MSEELGLKVKLCQVNFIVGDLEGNSSKIIKQYKDSLDKNLDLIIFSELAITGYPPEDLLNKEYFIKEVEEKISQICDATKNQQTAVIIGAPASFSNRYNESFLYNCAFLIENGLVKQIIRKANMPNYGVFDEKRYFKEAPNLTDFEFRGLRLAILICEDVWTKKTGFLLASKNIDLAIIINASPFSKKKLEKRYEVTRNLITAIKKPLIYVNQIGAQDSIIFDGASFVLDKDGKMVLQMQEFEEDSAQVKIYKNKDPQVIEGGLRSDVNTKDAELERIYNCCILGIRDYLQKNGFKKVIIGMSGGIDSALCACLAVDALGYKNVNLFALPSKYNSAASFKDAKECSKNLSVELKSISIENPILSIEKSLEEVFYDTKPDLTEENIQPRLRGLILMAISNKFNYLLLSTGNKSEMAVGYATIYGDMCGALNPLKDIYKTEIFDLANWRNKNIPKLSIYKKIDLIPINIITKEPTAELKSDQKDSDSLPEYKILDQILYNIIEEEKSIQEIIQLGFDANVVKKVAKLLFASEYKRKQAVIGLKISKMSFDKDRRYQITNKYFK